MPDAPTPHADRVTIGPCPVPEDQLVGTLWPAGSDENTWAILGLSHPNGKARWFVVAHRWDQEAAMTRARRSRYERVVVVPPPAVQEALEQELAGGTQDTLPGAARRHVRFLRERLIPDLRESGTDATADDFATCCDLIDALLREGGDAGDPAPWATPVAVVPIDAMPGESLVLIGPMPDEDAAELARRVAGASR